MPLIRQILTTGDFYYIESTKLSLDSKIFNMDITSQVLFQVWPQYAWESSFQPDSHSYFLPGFNNGLLKWNFIQMEDFVMLTFFNFSTLLSHTHTHTHHIHKQKWFIFVCLLTHFDYSKAVLHEACYQCNSVSASFYTCWQVEMKIIMIWYIC